MSSVAIIGALAATGGVMLPATSADAWQSPTKHRYMTKSLQICDQGAFYVGGAPKVTAFGGGPTPGPYSQIIVGDMYVQFATPMVAKSWPLIIVHGSGYTGSCVEGTAGGSEGWADYTVRNGVPTYVVDQAGRGRSGFDQTVIHEGEALIDTDPTAAKNLIPTLGGSTSTAWTAGLGISFRRAPTSRLARWSAMAPRRSNPMAPRHLGRIHSARQSQRTASNWGGSRWNLKLLGRSTKLSRRVQETDHLRIDEHRAQRHRNRGSGHRWSRQSSLPVERPVSGFGCL